MFRYQTKTGVKEKRQITRIYVVSEFTLKLKLRAKPT